MPGLTLRPALFPQSSHRACAQALRVQTPRQHFHELCTDVQAMIHPDLLRSSTAEISNACAHSDPHALYTTSPRESARLQSCRRPSARCTRQPQSRTMTGLPTKTKERTRLHRDNAHQIRASVREARKLARGALVRGQDLQAALPATAI